MTDRKKPSAGFWITVALVALLVGYPLSFGPACWISSRTGFGSRLLPNVYRPITMAMTDDFPDYAIADGIFYCYPEGVINLYARFGAREGWSWRCTGEYRIRDDFTGRLDRLSERWEWCGPP